LAARHSAADAAAYIRAAEDHLSLIACSKQSHIEHLGQNYLRHGMACRSAGRRIAIRPIRLRLMESSRSSSPSGRNLMFLAPRPIQ
jgi:hypothetical protein